MTLPCNLSIINNSVLLIGISAFEEVVFKFMHRLNRVVIAMKTSIRRLPGSESCSKF